MGFLVAPVYIHTSFFRVREPFLIIEVDSAYPSLVDDLRTGSGRSYPVNICQIYSR